MDPLPGSSFEPLAAMTFAVIALVYVGNLRLEAVTATLDLGARAAAAVLGIAL